MRVSERIFCSLLSDVDYIAKNNILGSMINKLDVLYAGIYMDQMSQTNNAAKGTMKESYRYYIYMPERIGWEMTNIILSYIVLKNMRRNQMLCDELAKEIAQCFLWVLAKFRPDSYPLRRTFISTYHKKRTLYKYYDYYKKI